MFRFLENISLKFFYRFVIAVEILFLILIFFLTLRINSTREIFFSTTFDRLKIFEVTNEINENMTNLTMMARLYAITGDAKYKDYYFNILAIRNGDLERPANYSSAYWDKIVSENIKPTFLGSKSSLKSRLAALNLSADEKKRLEDIYQNTNHLIKLEQQALAARDGWYSDVKGNLTVRGHPNPSLALQLLYSSQFFQEKNKITEPIASFFEKVNQRIKNKFQRFELAQSLNVFFLELCVIINILFALLAYWFVYRSMKQLDELINQVTAISGGNYTLRNTVNTKNEMGMLGETINQMSHSILKNLNSQEANNITLREKEERFRSMIEDAPIGIYITTLSGRFIFVNDALCQLLGYTKEKMLSLTIKDITLAEDFAHEKDLIQQLIEGKIKFFKLYQPHVHHDGHLIWTLLTVTTIKSGGEAIQLTAQIQDISERMQDEKQVMELNESLLSSNKDLRQAEHDGAMINKLNELLQICFTSNEAYPRINLIAKQLFPDLSGGMSILNKSTMMIETVEEWGATKLLVDAFLPNDCFAIRSGNSMYVEDANKALICLHFNSTPKGGILQLPMIVHGDIIGVMSFFAEEQKTISAKQQLLAISFNNTVKTALANIRLRELLREQTVHDPLTGLYNRKYLDEMLLNLLKHALRNNVKICLAMLDLDYFKRFNDDYGHEAGDEVLRFMGTLLHDVFRGSDIPCRFGGEEFLIVLQDTNLENAFKKLQEVSEEVKQKSLYFKDKLLPNITVSIGLAMAPDHASTPDELIRAAEQALYIAKQSGRERVVAFRAEKKMS